MHRFATLYRAVSLTAGMALLAQPVCAQASRPPRPYRSLFGTLDLDRPSVHALDLTASLNAAADDGLMAPGEDDARTAFEELYSAVAQLDYTLRARQLTGSARGSITQPYLPGFGAQLGRLGYGVNAALTYIAGATTTRTSGSYSYTPYYSMALDPAASAGAAAQPFDFALSRNASAFVSAEASIARRVGTRTSASLAYVFNQSTLFDLDLSLRSQEARLSAGRQLSRRLTARATYAYRDARFQTSGAPANVGSQDFDLGVGYASSGLRGQSTIVDALLGVSALQRRGLTSRPGLRGSVRLTRTFAPGWALVAGYGRTLQFHSVLQQPLWADVANAEFSGRLGRRVNLSVAGTYSNAQREAGIARGFEIYSLSARAQIGLTSFAALEAQFISYRYNVPAGYELVAGVPFDMNRRRLQLGASFWVPIVRAGSVREARSTNNAVR